MNAMPEHAMGSPEEELVITRVFDAPRQTVFKAWSECDHFMRWWGPTGYTTPHCTIDLRPGGLLHYAMRSPDGQEFWGKGIYQEIVPPERLVYTDSFADEQGNSIPASRYGLSPEWPEETLVSVFFDDERGKTRVTMRYGIPKAIAGSAQAREGWNQSLDRLETYLASVK